MQKINLIAQSVLELSHCENADNNDNNNNNDNDTHPGWIIVRVGRYSIADKNIQDLKIRPHVNIEMLIWFARKIRKNGHPSTGEKWSWVAKNGLE